LPTATDSIAILDGARVDDAIAHVSATGATHGGFS
jgi:hypothetical protein